MSILGAGLWLGEGDAERLADSIAGRATVVCLKGKIHEFGPTLERAEDVVYTGRRWSMGGWKLSASPFANPHTVKSAGSAARAVALYREHLREHPELVERARRELRGLRLACFCPEGSECHAALLAEIVEGAEP